MAAMIFVIILGAITYFSEMQYVISMERYYEGFKYALSAPSEDGSEGLVERKNLMFKEGSYYALDLERQFHFDSECVEFQATEMANAEIKGDGAGIELRQRMQIDVYYQCIKQPSGSECNTECYVSFGKKPRI